LVEADTSFWAAGDEFTVFEAADVKFSTPICFEDTFGYISRAFVNNGAELIINLTNDSWSESVAAAMQHMSMAVFRAVENRVSVVRSTNGGISCIIDPNGKIIEIYPAFVEGHMIGEVPIYTGRKTVYRVWGNWFPVVVLWTTAAVFAAGLVFWIIRKFRRKT
jgi:apolipoprotein N-acyltransferase